MSTIRLLGAAGVLALVLASPAAAHKRHHHHHKPKDVKVQLLSINDFHGHLQPTTTGGIRPPTPAGGDVPDPIAAGGAAFLGSYVRELEATNRNTLTVAAGDLIGGSPLLSALYHDEPAIKALNHIGLDLAAVGNHEFDEGADELKRMQRGGCHPTDGCQVDAGFEGADFKYLAANVIKRSNAKPFFRPYAIRRFQGKKIGFIGMTLEGTPSIVAPSGIASLQFLDEAATANRYARELRRRHGVKAIVVLLHEGGFPSEPFNTTTLDACGVTGPIVDIVKNTTKAVDLFITGHTHSAYNCVIDGRPVTSASSFGRVLTDVDMRLGRNGDVKSVKADNVPIFTAGREPQDDVQALIDRYDAASAELRQREVGRITADIRANRGSVNSADPSGEFPAGNLIADAQLADTDDPGIEGGPAVVALMNPGGVRADLVYADSGAPEDEDGRVSYEEAFTVQPFNNLVTTQTFTGTQLLEVLKDQWCGTNERDTILLPSDGFHYTWNAAIAASILGEPCAGADNPVSDVTIDGVPVTATGSYRITTNNFLADGGDDFLSLTQGTNRTTLPQGRFDIDSLVDYLQAESPVSPPALDRIDVE